MNESPDYSMKTFHIPSDNTSYFDKVNEKKIQEITEQINQQVRNEANQAIHNIVLGKDAEINDLKNKISELEEKLDTIEQNPLPMPEQPAGTVSDLTDFDIINNALVRALKYGETTKDELNNEQLETIRSVIVKWKEFFEEYKWKSNYISNKIKKLLKDTNDIL